MKYVLAVVALLLASSYAAPGKILELSKTASAWAEWSEMVIPKGEEPMNRARVTEGNEDATLANNPVREMVIPKGEEPMNRARVTKGNENAIVEDKPEFWIPFYDFFATIFQKKMPTPNAESKSLPLKQKRLKPNRDEFDDYNDYLDAHNDYLMKSSEESEESAELVNGNSEEDKAKFVHHKHPEHVKDALLYNKVAMPHRAEFEDYGEYLEETNDHLMPATKKSAEKPSYWSKWFSSW